MNTSVNRNVILVGPVDHAGSNKTIYERLHFRNIKVLEHWLDFVPKDWNQNVDLFLISEATDVHVRVGTERAAIANKVPTLMFSNIEELIHILQKYGIAERSDRKHTALKAKVVIPKNHTNKFEEPLDVDTYQGYALIRSNSRFTIRTPSNEVWTPVMINDRIKPSLEIFAKSVNLQARRIRQAAESTHNFCNGFLVRFPVEKEVSRAFRDMIDKFNEPAKPSLAKKMPVFKIVKVRGGVSVQLANTDQMVYKNIHEIPASIRSLIGEVEV